MSKFKRGQTVVAVDSSHGRLTKGQQYVVDYIRVCGDGTPMVCVEAYDDGSRPSNGYQEYYFEALPESAKPTNPKDAIGDSKLDYSVIPSTVLAYLSTAFFEGAAKYGKLNWRHCGVRGSVYTNALERHLQKYIGGEFVDPETGVPHLASVMACAGIILDAGIHGKLTDDRPDESKESVELIPVCAAIQQKLKAMHKDKKPLHYTRDRDNGTN